MNRKGFTLIELLIVVVIIGILAAIAIPKFANTKAKAYIASMKSDLRNLVTAEEAYFADSVKYSATMACTTRRRARLSISGGVGMAITSGGVLPAASFFWPFPRPWRSARGLATSCHEECQERLRLCNIL